MAKVQEIKNGVNLHCDCGLLHTIIIPDNNDSEITVETKYKTIEEKQVLSQLTNEELGENGKKEKNSSKRTLFGKSRSERFRRSESN